MVMVICMIILLRKEGMIIKDLCSPKLKHGKDPFFRKSADAQDPVSMRR